jgi:DNA-binding response OmpR family regulator
VKVLIAEDDRISRRLLEITLKRMNHEVLAAENGARAWEILQAENAPQLAVLDWMMPMMDGVDVCRLVRQQQKPKYVYLILLTAKGRKEDIVAGLEAGADDYVIKPFDLQELRSRIAVGERILRLESDLAGKINELAHALQHVKQLQGLLPICMFCKKIRDDGDAWHRLESYIEQHTEANFTHSVCTDCRARHFPSAKGKSP